MEQTTQNDIMKVLAVDFDGVLVRFKSPGKKARPAIADRECVIYLNTICQVTGAKVLISSDWVKTNTPAGLEGVMRKWGFTEEFAGALGYNLQWQGRDKVLALNLWVAGHAAEIGGLIVLDDEPLDIGALIKVRDQRCASPSQLLGREL